MVGPLLKVSCVKILYDLRITNLISQRGNLGHGIVDSGHNNFMESPLFFFFESRLL